MHSSDEGEYRKYRKSTGPGKGDRNRVSDLEAYRKGWEKIFGKKARRAYREGKLDERIKKAERDYVEGRALDSIY